MFCNNHSWWLIAVAILAVMGASCGGGSQNNEMSQAQAQAVSQELVTAVEQALTAEFSTAGAGSSPAQSSAKPGIAKGLADRIQPDGPVSCLTGSTINCTINGTATCPQGGSVSVSGSITGTLNNGSGSVDTSLTATPAGCVVDNLTINGDPNIAFTTDFNVTDDNLDFPVTATTDGGISFGPNPSGSCTLNVTVTINSFSNCSVSGKVCGQSVSGSC